MISRAGLEARRTARRLVLAATVGLLAAWGSACTAAPRPVTSGDPWKAAQIVRPADLARQLKAKGEHPLLLHVGFKVLYRGGAIPGSRYVGPGSTDEGLATLRAAVKDLPRDRNIVIYCGCCPWDHCPNMRPAFRTLAGLGFTHVRALFIAKNLESDWVNPGYPIEQPAE